MLRCPASRNDFYAFSLAKFFSQYSTYTSKNAFTLAEVLVTLGIIGVVAAMTLPVLIQSYKNHIVETRLQKFYSIMNQAIKMAEVEHGDKKLWYEDTGGLELDADGKPIAGSSKVLTWYNTYLAKYITTTKITVASNGIPTFYLADGSAFAPSNVQESRDWKFFPGSPEKCNSRYKIEYERYGRCMFHFEFYPISKSSVWKYLYDKGFEPTLYEWDGTENWLRNDSQRGCYLSNSSHVYCTGIIWYNGWKIPKDYPWRVNP